MTEHCYLGFLAFLVLLLQRNYNIILYFLNFFLIPTLYRRHIEVIILMSANGHCSDVLCWSRIGLMTDRPKYDLYRTFVGRLVPTGFLSVTIALCQIFQLANFKCTFPFNQMCRPYNVISCNTKILKFAIFSQQIVPLCTPVCDLSMHNLNT